MAARTVDYFGKSFNINYEMVNNKADQWIVFLHGWGSNKEIMKQAFGDKLANLNHLYIDMPGFGKSVNNYVLTTIDYANIVKIFLENLRINPNEAIIAGHSFGGKVATTLMPKLLVLLSSAGILEPKPLKVQIKIKIAKLLKTLGLSNISKIFRSKDVENMDYNMYETFKNVVDEDFTQHFQGYYKEALIFWGEKDTATSLSSGEKIHALIKKSEFKAYDGDHYFFINSSNDICDIIKSHITKKDKN
jgi:pimeloyl-ACP methyl ester carboxylesterase